MEKIVEVTVFLAMLGCMAWVTARQAYKHKPYWYLFAMTVFFIGAVNSLSLYYNSPLQKFVGAIGAFLMGIVVFTFVARMPLPTYLRIIGYSIIAICIVGGWMQVSLALR